MAEGARSPVGSRRRAFRGARVRSPAWWMVPVVALGLAFLLLPSSFELAIPGSPGYPSPAAGVPHSLVAASNPSTALANARRSLQASLATGQVPAAGCVGVHQAQYPEVNPVQRQKDLRCAYLAGRASAAARGWVNAADNPPAFYLYDFVFSYDSSDGYVVLFGQPIAVSPSAPPETWVYVNSTWKQLSPPISPASCLSSSFANDPSAGGVIYLAGTTSANGSACPSAGQTWEYRAGAWSQLHPVATPSPRFAASFTNDSADGYLLLFGGISSACQTMGNVCNDTWNFSHGNWTQLHPRDAPTNRSSAGMTYDAADGYVLLFGGEGANGTVYTMLNDTWTFRAGNWTEIFPSNAPPQPFPDGLAYDYADGYALYTQVCGNITNAIRREVTWEFVGGVWSALAGSCSYTNRPGDPPWQRLGEGLTFDGSTGTILFFGGGGIYFHPPFWDTWSFRAGNWTNDTPVDSESFLPVDPAYAYDAADDAVILFGGWNSTSVVNQTWEWSRGNWSLLHPTVSPPARDSASMTYDASDGYVVLFGGDSAHGALNDTWEFVAGNWTELTPTRAPPRWGGPGNEMVYDGADGYVLYTLGGETWTYHAGVWTNLTSSSGVAPEYPPNGLAYDASDGYVLEFGTSTNATYAFAGGRWANITANTTGAPPTRWSGSMAGMGPSGGVVLFGGYCLSCSSLSTFDDTWIYLNHTWQNWSGEEAPSPGYETAFVYDTALGEGVLFGGVNWTTSPANSLWYWEPAPATPYVTTFSARPNVVDEGAATEISVGVWGGVSPIQYTYTGLPSGCSSQDAPSFDCVPANGSAGNYSLTVIATDANGNSVAASISLVVHARPSVVSFTASPSSGMLGGRVIFQTVVAGGTSPYTYWYAGLPAGCTSQTVPTLPCIPESAGTYAPKVSVVDAVGEWANASIPLFNVSPLQAGTLVLDGFSAGPAELLLGNLSYLNVTATAAVGVVSYTYGALPAGCASANVSSLVCLPTAAGSFDPQVTVTDGLGHSLTLTTPLTVFPTGAGGSLSVRAYGATPSNLPLGATTVLWIDVASLSSSISYAYAGLPAGCSTQNRSVLPCTPLVSGQFVVAFYANASSGARAVAYQPLTITPAAIGGPRPSIASFVVSPSDLDVGSTFTATLIVADAPPTTSYAYAGLPPGCASVNASSWSCTVEQAGTYSIEAEVGLPSTPFHLFANATVTVHPVSPAPPATTRSGGGSGYSATVLALGIIAAAAASALATVALLRRRPQRPPPRRGFAEARVSDLAAEPPGGSHEPR
jgi:hypothetical protein